jgi:hypothetical protein
MRVHANWLSAYLQYTEETEAPSDFHLWTAMVTLAGAVQRKVWIDLAHFQWVANLYVLLVGEPGIVTKSTSIRIGRNLLRGVKGFYQGPDSVTWQALIDSFGETSHAFKVEGGEMVQSPISLYIAEVGNFLDPDNREAMDLLTDMWDGQATTFTRRTKAHGAQEIVNPWLNFIGCTTPTWIQNNFSADLVGGGFASRLIVVYGDKKRKYIAYPGISAGGLKVEMEESLSSDLRHIARLQGPMSLTKEALEWGEIWYAGLQAGLGKEVISRRASGYYARKQTHLHKLAMLISIAESDELIITKEHLIRAEGILIPVERDIMRVLSNVTNRVVSSRNSLEIIQVLRAGQNLTDNQVYSHLYSFMTKRDFDTALADLIAAGIIYAESVGGKSIMRLKKTMME